jgi:hypothetical protein
MNKLDIARNALLVTTVLLLIYVLYKRLINILQKQHIQTDFPELGNSINWKTNKMATIEVKLEQPMELEIEVFNTQSDLIISIAKKHFEVGQHQFDIDLSSAESGRYYYKVISAKQQASQYFDLA